MSLGLDSERVEAASSLQLILKEHTGVVIAAEWMCDGKQLVTASWDHTSKLWDAEHGKCVSTLSGNGSWVALTFLDWYCLHHRP